MTKQKRTKYQIIGLISLSLIVAAATYGFAEVNTMGTTGLLGVGYGVRSDYQVSRISYVLDEEAPTNFVAVNFQIEDEVGSLTAGVSESKDSQIIWADSCEGNGIHWTCSFDQSLDVLMADWLHVQ